MISCDDQRESFLLPENVSLRTVMNFRTYFLIYCELCFSLNCVLKSHIDLKNLLSFMLIFCLFIKHFIVIRAMH